MQALDLATTQRRQLMADLQKQFRTAGDINRKVLQDAKQEANQQYENARTMMLSIVGGPAIYALTGGVGTTTTIIEK